VDIRSGEAESRRVEEHLEVSFVGTQKAEQTMFVSTGARMSHPAFLSPSASRVAKACVPASRGKMLSSAKSAAAVHIPT
jgi:hypothetical protein